MPAPADVALVLARSLVLVTVLISLLLAAGPLDAAQADRASLSRGRAVLKAPSDAVSIQARVRHCQRGRRLTLVLGQQVVRVRLPRSGAVRHRWRVSLGAGPVRWRARVATGRRRCAKRLSRGALVFTARRTDLPVAPARPELPAPRAVAAGPVSGPPVALGAAIDTAALDSDAAYAAGSARFGSWTPENALKMEPLVPDTTLLGAPRYRFATADALVDRALAEGRHFHGHALVFKNQIPAWVRERRWKEGELRSFLREYVGTVVRRYRGRIASWDVVNEPLNHLGRFDDSTFWARSLGPSYIADAFRWAKEADPEATLYLNEVLDVANPVSDGIYDLVRSLKAENVPVEGVGLQTHVQARQTVLTEQAFFDIYTRFAGLGVKIAVSEMDVETAGPVDAMTQAQVYGNAARACARVPACERFTVWGVSDRYSWLGSQKAALPIDGEHQPKPAWSAITEALAARGAGAGA